MMDNTTETQLMPLCGAKCAHIAFLVLGNISATWTVILNLVVLVASIRMRDWTPSTFGLISLIVADLTGGCASVGFSHCGYQDYMVSHPAMCLLQGITWVVPIGTSMWTMGLMSLDRALMFSYNPEEYSRLRVVRFFWVLVLLAWLFWGSVFIGSAVYSGKPTFCVSPYFGCFVDLTLSNWIMYVMMSSLTAGMLLIILCYVRIWKEVSKIIKKGRYSEEEKDSVLAAKSTFLIIVVFFSCWSPGLVYTVWALTDSTHTPGYNFALELSFSTVQTNSMLNPIIMTVTLRNLRKQVGLMFGFRPMRLAVSNNVNESTVCSQSMDIQKVDNSNTQLPAVTS